MIITRQEDVTRAVLDELSRASNPRFRDIMSAAVRHLHDFAREVKLTEAEFHQACSVIAKLGIGGKSTTSVRATSASRGTEATMSSPVSFAMSSVESVRGTLAIVPPNAR